LTKLNKVEIKHRTLYDQTTFISLDILDVHWPCLQRLHLIF